MHGPRGSGSGTATDGEGRPAASTPIASDYERFAFLVNWVERGVAPGMSLRLSATGSYNCS